MHLLIPEPLNALNIMLSLIIIMFIVWKCQHYLFEKRLNNLLTATL